MNVFDVCSTFFSYQICIWVPFLPSNNEKISRRAPQKAEIFNFSGSFPAYFSIIEGITGGQRNFRLKSSNFYLWINLILLWVAVRAKTFFWESHLQLWPKHAWKFELFGELFCLFFWLSTAEMTAKDILGLKISFCIFFISCRSKKCSEMSQSLNFVQDNQRNKLESFPKSWHFHA